MQAPSTSRVPTERPPVEPYMARYVAEVDAWRDEALAARAARASVDTRRA